MRRALVALFALVAAGCHRAPTSTSAPVRLYVAPGLPGAIVAELARGFAIADPTLVAGIDEAEVAWLPDPTAAIALGDRAAPGSAPAQPGVPDGFLDPKRRFAPVGAVARVIVAGASRAAPFTPSALSELADPRARGMVALTRLDGGDGPLLTAALELAYGERGTLAWLDRLAANQPLLVESDAEAVARVAAGAVPFGLADSLTAGAALQRGAVRVVFTDQKGKGCVVIPTALVVLPGAGPAARKLSAWMAGPTAETVLVQRAIGLLPLRAQAVAPAGIEPAWRLRILTLDWTSLAAREPVWEGRLAGWPARPRRGR